LLQTVRVQSPFMVATWLAVLSCRQVAAGEPTQAGCFRPGRVQDELEVRVRTVNPGHRHSSAIRPQPDSFQLFRLLLAPPCSILARWPMITADLTVTAWSSPS
jgi:hypothetical protein